MAFWEDTPESSLCISTRRPHSRGWHLHPGSRSHQNPAAGIPILDFWPVSSTESAVFCVGSGPDGDHGPWFGGAGRGHRAVCPPALSNRTALPSPQIPTDLSSMTIVSPFQDAIETGSREAQPAESGFLQVAVKVYHVSFVFHSRAPLTDGPRCVHPFSWRRTSGVW